jgi:hypothetical protein
MRRCNGRTVPHATSRWHTRDMTRVTLVVGLCVLAVTGSAVGALGATSQARPALGVVDTSPFDVRGFGFQPGERVQVLLTVNARQYWRSTVAAGNGTFRASFQASLGPCGRFVLRALGSRGSRVRVLQRRPIPDCVSPTGVGSHT